MQDAFWGILIPFLGTSLGAGCVFFLKNALRDGIQRALTGFAAGVMVAASVWSLLIPEMSQGQHSNVGTVFFAVGFSVMMVLDVALGGRVEPAKAKSFSESPKMPKLLDRGNSRAYYFGRRTAEKRLFIEQKVSFA